MKIAKFVVYLLSLPFSVAHAQDTSNDRFRAFWTGNNLYEWCSKAEPNTPQGEINTSNCRMYVVGVVDAVFSIHDTGCMFALPSDITMQQLQDVVTRHLREEPESRHYTAYSQVVVALKAAFPCR
jgi:hypothetical protein